MVPVLAVAGAVLVIFVLMYNSLVVKRNQVSNVFGTMDAMLKKRHDLIPNLAETVKGYASHEKALFEEVTDLRSRVSKAASSENGRVALDGLMTGLLGRLMVTVENYPQLKADSSFLHLQHSLAEIEEQISAARRAYNAAVTSYNTALEVIPTTFVARMFSFRPRELFQIEEAEKAAVSVRKHLTG